MVSSPVRVRDKRFEFKTEYAFRTRPTRTACYYLFSGNNDILLYII